MKDRFDLLIVGGGVNGAGIARDATGRGLSILLVEQDDLAQHTSSASTKLIHGGLRYLEQYEFRLVREALMERERLLQLAPHLVSPMQFVLPQKDSPRPAWMVSLGLFLYDHIGGASKLPSSRKVHIRDTAYASGLQAGTDLAFLYSDCWADDSRLVVLNALDAAQRGATILTRTRLLSATRVANQWSCELADMRTSRHFRVTARSLVNAAGPWVSELLCERVKVQRTKSVRLVKGSHIVVPKLYEGKHAFMLQNPDRRIIFVIPFEQKYSLIGTTDIPWTSQPGPAVISEEETSYLCASANRYFERQLTARDVAWSYAGVRPLFDDAAKNATAVTRDYVLDIDAPLGQAALLSVFGGKITTYRKLAEHALQKLTPHLQCSHGPWTATEALPGGDMEGASLPRFLAVLQNERPFLPAALTLRLAKAYGTRARQLLGSARSLAELGEHFGAGLYQAEVDYLRAHEWAQTADDILLRRSKLRLHVNADTVERLTRYMLHPAPMHAIDPALTTC